MASFSLIDQPWVPCTMLDGTRRPLGLRDVLTQAPSIGEVGGDSPLVVAAIYRLLLALLHRNFDIDDERKWGAHWKSRAFDVGVIDDYFERWRDRFNLFDDEKPFYQVASLDETKARSIANLLFHQDNNPTLFTHLVKFMPPELTPAEAARSLIAYMAFDVGGTKTSELGQESAKAALLNKGAILIAKGDNLYQTLMLNLCRYAPDHGEPWEFDQVKDLPAWERVGTTAPIDRKPDGYIDLLTWQSRRIRLQPEIRKDGTTVVRYVVIMKGFQPPEDFTLHGKEPMLAFQRNANATKSQEPWPSVTYREGRALWRDSLALIQAAGVEDKTLERPKTLGWLADLVDEESISRSAIVPLDIFGLGSNRAKIEFWRHERLPLPVTYLGDDGLVASIKTALDLAENAARDLSRVIWSMGRGILAAGQDRRPETSDVRDLVNHLAAERAYWSRLEGPFKQLMADLPGDADDDGDYGDEQLPNWRDTVRSTLWHAFNESTRGLERSPRTLKEMAIAERRLAGRTHEYLSTREQV